MRIYFIQWHAVPSQWTCHCCILPRHVLFQLTDPGVVGRSVGLGENPDQETGNGCTSHSASPPTALPRTQYGYGRSDQQAFANILNSSNGLGIECSATTSPMQFFDCLNLHRDVLLTKKFPYRLGDASNRCDVLS